MDDNINETECECSFVADERRALSVSLSAATPMMRHIKVTSVFSRNAFGTIMPYSNLYRLALLLPPAPLHSFPHELTVARELFDKIFICIRDDGR